MTIGSDFTDATQIVGGELGWAYGSVKDYVNVGSKGADSAANLTNALSNITNSLSDMLPLALGVAALFAVVSVM